MAPVCIEQNYEKENHWSTPWNKETEVISTKGIKI